MKISKISENHVRKFWQNSSKILDYFFQNVPVVSHLFSFSIFIFCFSDFRTNSRKNVILELCKGVHCVDLGESFPTSIYLQNLASMQPRTSLVKFARSPRTDHYYYYYYYCYYYYCRSHWPNELRAASLSKRKYRPRRGR